MCKLCSVSINMQTPYGAKNWNIHMKNAGKGTQNISSFFLPVEKCEEASPFEKHLVSLKPKRCPGIFDPSQGEERLQLMSVYGDYANLEVRIETVAGKTSAHVTNCTGQAVAARNSKYYARCCEECWIAGKTAKSDAFNFLRRLKNMDSIEIVVEALKKTSLCDFELTKMNSLSKIRQSQPNAMFDALKHQVLFCCCCGIRY